MKVLLLILVAVGLCFYECYGQKANVGVKGGMNIQDLQLDASSIKSNYHLGAVFKYDVSKTTSLSIEGLYNTVNRKGHEQEIAIESVQIPLALKYFFKKPLYIQTGVQGNYLMSQRDESGKLPIEADRISYSYLGGVGVGLPSGFDFSIRYLHPSQPNQFNSPLVQVSLAFDIY